MFCKNCGRELPDESLFCGYCGAQLEEKNEPAGFSEEPQEKSIKVPKINISADDFIPLLKVIANPFEKTDLGVYAACTAALAGLIAGWMQFGFGYALLILAVFYAASAGIIWFNDGRFEPAQLLSDVTQLLTVPVLLMLVSGIFSLIAVNSFIVMFRLFLMALALIIFTMACAKRADSLNRYVLASVIALVTAIAASCALSTLAEIAANGLSFY